MAFANKGMFKELLRDFHAYELIHFDKDEDFLVEVAFLNQWDAKLQEEHGGSGIKELKIGDCTVSDSPGVAVRIIHNTGAIATMLYVGSHEHPGRHGLIIEKDDNAVYARRASQDPATEWDINMMAGDSEVTDEEGNPLFEGEPVNI